MFPIFFADAGLSVGAIGVLAATYPFFWGFGQLVTGTLSDRIGRKPLIAGGMLIQAVGDRHDRGDEWLLAVGGRGRRCSGVGTAMVYPTLLAAIGDVAHPLAGAVGRHLPAMARCRFAVGALLAGVLADAVSIEAAIYAVAVLTAAVRAWS